MEPNQVHFSREKGLSIVELLVALALSGILMAGALQVFISSKESFAFNEELTWVQESSRFTMEFLTRDARMAGYFGCGSNSVANTLKPSTASDAWKYSFDEGMVGYDGDDANFPSVFPVADRPTLASGALPKSDVLTILRGNTEGDLLTVTGHNTSSAVISVNAAHGYLAGRILVVTDCDHAAIFQTTGNNPNKLGHNKGGSVSPGNCTKGLGVPVVCTANGTAYEYGGDAQVMDVRSHAYYVDTASNGIPTMYRQEITGGTDSQVEELAQGIENIQFFFGTDTNDDGVANRYIDADDVSDWEDVVSLRIHVLARTVSQVSTEATAFRFIGNTYTPTDKYLRKEFISTVKIRNKGV